MQQFSFSVRKRQISVVISTSLSFKTISAPQLKRLHNNTRFHSSAELNIPDSQPYQPFIQTPTSLPRIPSSQFGCSKRGSTVPAWTYLFSHTASCVWDDLFPPQYLSLFQATHTAEIPFVFGNTDNLPIPNANFIGTSGTCSFNPSEQLISQALVEAWTSLAATGDPS